jgi:hypothetical protein
VHAVIGGVKIKPDRADEAFSMIGERGVAMLRKRTRSRKNPVELLHDLRQQLDRLTRSAFAVL